MCRYVGVVMYQGLVEDVSVFKGATEAEAWVTVLRQLYGWEDTLDSGVWEVGNQQSLKRRTP